MTEFEKEKEKLEKIISKMNEIKTEESVKLDKYYEEVKYDDNAWYKISESQNNIKNINKSLDRPYFARIDFKFKDKDTIDTQYIGRYGIFDNGNIIITDWRAPISSLYYDSEIGECSFQTSTQTIHGLLKLKRQFEISKGELIDFFDVNLVTEDSLLQKYLNENNDARLKSIVATIQKEQNKAIRKKISDNLIVQGVAGSGKTTVALHRIAYLVYNYLNTIKQNQYMVLGPNPVFLKYIKSVLPELDVDAVSQLTYEEFSKKYIDEEIIINSSDKKLIKNISGKATDDIDKFKCSMKYKEMLDKFLQVYFYSITSQPLMLGNFEVLSQEIIKETFLEIKNEYPRDLSTIIEMTIDRLNYYIEKHHDSISSKFFDYSYELFKIATTIEEKDKMRNMLAKNRSELEKNCKSILRSYFSKKKINTTKLYKLFLSSINDFDIYNYKNLGKLKKETLKNIKDNSYDFEDLAALIYIKSAISPNNNYSDIKHVVIDEAQDLGEFNFFALKKTLPSATFSIFGDLAQSIYDYRSINNWDEVNNVMFEGNGEIINFNKSYRTTSEIMSIADDVAESIGLNRSDSVIRHGNSVQIDEVENANNIPEYIYQKVEEFKEKGYKSIAIISKTNLLSNYINDDLKALGLDIPNVTANDDLTEERFKICTISNQLAKGLEFDAVIINDAGERIYSSDNNLDMKLLYVAITRALHELSIVYHGQLTKPLQMTKNKVKVKEK